MIDMIYVDVTCSDLACVKRLTAEASLTHDKTTKCQSYGAKNTVSKTDPENSHRAVRSADITLINKRNSTWPGLLGAEAAGMIAPVGFYRAALYAPRSWRS